MTDFDTVVNTAWNFILNTVLPFVLNSLVPSLSIPMSQWSGSPGV
jgi:hypothetical protein